MVFRFAREPFCAANRAAFQEALNRFGRCVNIRSHRSKRVILRLGKGFFAPQTEETLDFLSPVKT